MSIPPILNQEAQFSGWMACFHALMMKPLPLVSAAKPTCFACAEAACSTLALLRLPGLMRHHLGDATAPVQRALAL